MMAGLRNYAFPARAELLNAVATARSQAVEPFEAERRAALAQGYETGLAEGRTAAAAELGRAAAAAREQAAAEARAGARVELERSAQALHAALEALVAERQALAADVEAFAIELALAVVAKLVEVDEARASFVVRAIAAAVRTIAPDTPRRVLLNPADLALARSALADLSVAADETIAPGGTRVEGGRLLVEAGLTVALEQIRTALHATRARRVRERATAPAKPLTLSGPVAPRANTRPRAK